MNAKKVNQDVLDEFSKYMKADDIYVTHSIEEADQSMDKIIEKRYPLVLCGGGDGTVMRIIEQMNLRVKERNRDGGDYKIPKFCILKLGTGNAISGLLEVPKGAQPILSVRQSAEEELNFKRFNIIEADKRIFHFGGFGIDALVVNDHIDFKNRFSKGFMWRLTNTLAGYFMAVILKSIPKVVLHGFKLNIRIINDSDSPVYKATHSRGIEETPFKKGDVIFEGPADVVVFGTTTDFGYKLRAMPFAFAKPGYFNLRLGDTGVFKLLLNLRPLWKGTIEHPGLYDFLVQKVKIEFDEKAPLQLGGDPEGYRKELHLKISNYTPDILDFRE